MTKDVARRANSSRITATMSASARPPISMCFWPNADYQAEDAMGLLGILIGLAFLVLFAFRGWSVLLLAPAAALIAALFGGQPLLASWTQIFMSSAARFLAQFFPLFLLGAVFGKLMDDSGSVSTVAQFMTRTMGQGRAMLALV